MFYVVVLHDTEQIFYLGWSKDYNMAEKYLELREDVDSEDDNIPSPLKYDILMFSDDKFREMQTKITGLGACSEICGLHRGDNKDPIYISDDDFDMVMDSVNGCISQMINYSKDMETALEIFDDKDCEELRKLLKKVRKKLDDSNIDIDEYNLLEHIKWKKAIKRCCL